MTHAKEESGQQSANQGNHHLSGEEEMAVTDQAAQKKSEGLRHDSTK